MSVKVRDWRRPAWGGSERVARRFLAAVAAVRAAAGRLARALEEVEEELKRHVPLPMPSFSADASAEARCLWVVPPALRPLLRLDKIVKVRAVAIDGRIWVYIRGEERRDDWAWRYGWPTYAELLLNRWSASWLHLVTVALVYDHLLQQGVDLLAQLEEELKRPGLFEELRLLLQSVAAAVSPLLSGASRQAAPGVVEEVDEGLVRTLAAAMEGRVEGKVGLGLGLIRPVDIHLPLPIQEEVRMVVEPPLELPPSLSRLAGKRLPESVSELVVRADEEGRLGRLVIFVRGRGGVSRLELNCLGHAAAAAILWDLFRRHRGIDFFAPLRRRIEEEAEQLPLLKEAKVICRLFGVIPDG